LSIRRFVAILFVSLAVATALRFAARPRLQKDDTARLAPRVVAPDSGRLPRKIYPYSVIPGGAYSGDELALARRVDRVVAAHYSDFETGAVAVRALRQDTYLYVSYRKADRVYWTANKRRIPKGETVLSDGKHLARTRCGNRLSETPQLPVAAGLQPTETALNGPEAPGGIELPQGPLFAPQYDAPSMPLVDARERFFAFPNGVTGASPLEAFPGFGPHSPMMAVADLPFGVSGVASATGPGGSSPGGSTPGGSTPGGSSPGGSTPGSPGGSTPGGSTPGGPSSGGPTGGGPVPGAAVPEPASIALLIAGTSFLVLLRRRVRRGHSPTN
jgi:uncharacterized membrane protein YgcG